MSSYETKKANITVLSTTIIVIIYLLKIVWSFFGVNGPQNENSDNWAYALAPLHFALILFPAILIYAFIFAKNILKVKYIRWIIYPACFLAFYLMAFIGAFIVSSMMFWLFIFISTPTVLMFLGLEIFAIIYDIIDFKNKNSENSNPRVEKIQQNIINVIMCVIILPLLAIGTYFAATKSHWDSGQSSWKCADFYDGLQLLSKNVDVKSYKDFESLTDAYKKELDKDIYKNILGDYDKVEFDTGQYKKHLMHDDKPDDVSVIKWITFYLYNDGKAVSSFNFETDEDCSKDKENCSWHLFDTYSSCTFYQEKNGRITPEKRTKNFIKYNNK